MNYEVITSTQNARVKEIASLKEKKFREKAGLYLVEGVKMVKEGLALGAEITQIFCTEKYADFFPSELTTVVSQTVYEKISLEVTPQGVLATVKIPKEEGIPPCKSCVFLDGLQDPGNVGTILRTMAALGLEDVYAANCVDVYNPKVIRSSMSGIFRVRVHRGDYGDLLPALSSMPIVVCDTGGKNVFREKIALPVCLVVGNEGNGVSEKMRNLATETVSLPMKEGVESLNAAVSLSVLLYTIINQ